MKNSGENMKGLVGALTAEEYGKKYTVIPKGFINQRKRQVIVLVDYRFDFDLSRRIVFDAKDRKRPVDITETESFEGLMKDVGSRRGFIVCSNGYTKSALRRAQEHIVIKLLASDEINIASWDMCRNDSCSDGLIMWDLTPGVIIDGTV